MRVKTASAYTFYVQKIVQKWWKHFTIESILVFYFNSELYSNKKVNCICNPNSPNQFLYPRQCSSIRIESRKYLSILVILRWKIVHFQNFATLMESHTFLPHSTVRKSNNCFVFAIEVESVEWIRTNEMRRIGEKRTRSEEGKGIMHWKKECGNPKDNWMHNLYSKNQRRWRKLWKY